MPWKKRASQNLNASSDTSSDPRIEVSHQVGVNPVDDVDIEISQLVQSRTLGIPGTAIAPNHIRHAPVTMRLSLDGASAIRRLACFINSVVATMMATLLPTVF